VHVCDVDERALQHIAKNNPQVIGTHLDVSNEPQFNRWFDKALDDMNGLDVLINNAGTKGRPAMSRSFNSAIGRNA